MKYWNTWGIFFHVMNIPPLLEKSRLLPINGQSLICQVSCMFLLLASLHIRCLKESYVKWAWMLRPREARPSPFWTAIATGTIFNNHSITPGVCDKAKACGGLPTGHFHWGMRLVIPQRCTCLRSKISVLQSYTVVQLRAKPRSRATCSKASLAWFKTG